jgi:hypothetical protein
MAINDNPQARTVALYWDFENIHAGLCEEKDPGAYARGDFRFKPQEPLVNIQAVMDMAASFGPIAINRAYCNWQFFSRYRDQLLQHAVELIQLFPPGGAAKNGADIKLCLDAVEDIARFAHVGTVIIVGGDSDFMPVSQKIKAAGRTLVGVGTRRATNRHWAKSCHEFRYYESLVEDHARTAGVSSPLAPAETPTAGAPVADLLRRALRLLAEKRGEPWVDEAEVWPMIKRLDPTFDLAEHGCPTFADLLKTQDAMVELRQADGVRMLRLR